MTAFNAVRFKVKPGREREFLDAFCIIAEWTDMDAFANARPHMIATLDTFRGTLEDLGAGLGVTDPVAGPVVLALK